MSEQAIKDLQFLQERFAGIVALIPDLVQAGSAQRLVAMVEENLARLKREEAMIFASIKARAEAEAKESASAIVRAAEEEARGLVEDATGKANDAVDKGKREGDRLLLKAQEEVKRAEARRDDLVRRHGELEGFIAGLEAKKKEALQALKATLESAE